MDSTRSKDLLQFERANTPTTSSLESRLLVCSRNKKEELEKIAPPSDGKPITTPVLRSPVLGKVKDFLGVISEANQRLQQDAKDNPQNYDIEVITGDESQVIEMDLMLGLADLHTPEAVEAAKAAIANGQSFIPLDDSSSESEDESTDDDDMESDGDNENQDQNQSNPANYKKKGSLSKHKASKSSKIGSSDEARKNSSKKRPKITELS